MVILTISNAPSTYLSDEAEIDFTESVQSCVSADAVILKKLIAVPKQPSYFEEKILAGKSFIQEILITPTGQELFFKIRSGSFFSPILCKRKNCMPWL